MSAIRDPAITLAHGAGGRAMRELIEGLIVPAFANPRLDPLEDQARFALAGLAEHGDRLAFSTDSHVVKPLFFPGGDIGKLAVCGTVNDLAMAGALPLALSCALVIEEGLPMPELQRVIASIAAAARDAGVEVVTGDTKVVERGAADRLFVNTAGLGVIPRGVQLAAERSRPGDRIVVSGTLGDHATAILIARNELALQADIASDCQPLHGLVRAMLAAAPGLRCLRDATRGGVATVLNEFAASAQVAMRIDERALPVRDAVRGASELLGLDVLYLANEGKLVAVVAPGDCDALLAAMRAHPAGRDAAAIGEVLPGPAGSVLLDTRFGGTRMVDLLVGEQLPRIC